VVLRDSRRGTPWVRTGTGPGASSTATTSCPRPISPRQSRSSRAAGRRH